MNECEQIHPLLRGYLAEELSARDRRLVARHLNLCASARKELDRFRSGPLKTPSDPAGVPSEPWDLKILRWLFKTPKPGPKTHPSRVRKARPVEIPDEKLVRSPSPLKPILGIILFFAALVFLTHLIQNADGNPLLKGTKRWLSRHGFHILGVKPSLELIQDLTGLPSWNGALAPTATPYQGLITDRDHFRIYWQILRPGVDLPEVDFNQNALAIVFLGAKVAAGMEPKFLRVENYTDRTVLFFDEVLSPGAQAAGAGRPWVLQVVPKPDQEPVLIQKVP